MKIFKFGGASVKDAEGVKNVLHVLNTVGHEDVLLVISAMGKTTNALEVVIKNYFDKSKELHASLQEVRKYHNQILLDLFEDEDHDVFFDVNAHFDDLEYFIRSNKSPNYSFVYDQVVSIGELVSTTIVSHYFNYSGLKNNWIDVRPLIKTDNNYRDGQVDWETTQKLISKGVKKKTLNITQGFLGSDENNFTTTLGREGSDYTAAIFAYCLGAESVTIWKDVPGVLNADPRYFENAVLLNQISYREAIELAFYGASVIHPKTLQPLKQKHIPFYVKSFVEPEKPGTKVGNSDVNQSEESYILKENQVLMNISTRDFSFIAEDHISQIFNLLAKHKIKVSMMQNSAISLALCLEDKFGKIDEVNQTLTQQFSTDVVKNVSLYTVRNANMDELSTFYADKKILLEQISKNTVQIVTQ